MSPIERDLGSDAATISVDRRSRRAERFFASDRLTRAPALAAIYPKQEAMQRVLDFLQCENVIVMEDTR
jgi:hypothetical protein